MPSYVTPKKNVAFVFNCSLTSQSNTKTFQSAPTLAVGDVKVYGDGALVGNITTLPTASGKVVTVSLSASEMNFDNVSVVFSDVAGAEWCDLTVPIQTSARQIDDLSPSLNVTTIATLATQTSFTLTAGSADDDAYNGCYAVIEDATTAVQKAVVSILDYTGSTRTVTLGAAPIFTIATTDRVVIIPVNLSNTTVKLTSDGLDAILVESGISASSALTNDSGTQLTAINMRQAAALFLSTLAGVLSGVLTGTPAFKPGGKSAGNTRVSSVTSTDGRTSVTLKTPD